MPYHLHTGLCGFWFLDSGLRPELEKEVVFGMKVWEKGGGRSEHRKHAEPRGSQIKGSRAGRGPGSLPLDQL